MGYKFFLNPFVFFFKLKKKPKKILNRAIKITPLICIICCFFEFSKNNQEREEPRKYKKKSLLYFFFVIVTNER